MQWGFWHLGQFATISSCCGATVDDCTIACASGCEEEAPLPGGQSPSGRYSQSRT